MHTGSCLCGEVRFRVTGKLQPIQVCHCQQCRKAQGTPFATNTPVAMTAFELLSGAELLADFESSPGKHRYFCKRCGSPIYSRLDTLPERLRLRVGLLNEPLVTRPVAHFHMSSQCNWWPVDDDLPQFAEAYLPSPD